jgi:hypothetical protein
LRHNFCARSGINWSSGVDEVATMGTRQPEAHMTNSTPGDARMYWLLGAIYVVLGVLSLRKGHWIMFIAGIFVPLFWVIGAVMPTRRQLAAP